MNGFDPNTARIVYASDDKFAEILGVSMVSLFENNKDMGEIFVYILDSGIREENREKLIAVCRTYGRSVEFLPATDISKKLSMQVAADRGSLSQYARLFISSDLPEDTKRVLYLDCDIVVNKSIRELWNLDLHGKTIGALMDAFSKYYRANIDLEKNDIMFNSGVMLIDVKKWKEQRIEEKLIKFIQKKQGKIQQGDQGVLNAVLSHDTYCFEPRFNAVTIFFDFTYEEMMVYRKPPVFYSKEEVEKAVREPVIIHFTTSFLSKRPWEKECEHQYVKEWIKYKNLSPWRNKPLWKSNKLTWKTLGINLLKKFRGLLYLISLLQVYGRPIKNKIVY